MGTTMNEIEGGLKMLQDKRDASKMIVEALKPKSEPTKMNTPPRRRVITKRWLRAQHKRSGSKRSFKVWARDLTDAFLAGADVTLGRDPTAPVARLLRTKMGSLSQQRHNRYLDLLGAKRGKRHRSVGKAPPAAVAPVVAEKKGKRAA